MVFIGTIVDKDKAIDHVRGLTVTVAQELLGTLPDPSTVDVVYQYNDTWGYMCTDAPGEVGEMKLFLVHNEEDTLRVTYAFSADSPLYDVVLDELDVSVDLEPTQPEPTVIRATLMQQVVQLLTSLLALLTGVSEPESDPTPTVPNNPSGEVTNHDQIISLTQTEAEAYAKTEDVRFRIGMIDGEPLALTMDFVPGRITAELTDGIVTGYSIE